MLSLMPCRRCVLSLALLSVVVALGASRAYPQVVYIVRHAEKATDKDASDPPLTTSGMQRARDLTRTLRSVKLSAIYATEYKRTQQTVAPTAERTKIKPTLIKADNTKQLALSLKRRARGEVVLVGGHSHTVPPLLAALGVKERVSIRSADYDNLFVVVFAEEGPPLLLHLHYGAPAEPSAPSSPEK